jgi:hypothetical protein
VCGVDAALIWAECKHLWVLGPMEYITDMWHILDFCTNSLYVATFATKIIAFVIVSSLLIYGSVEILNLLVCI